jgi:hypothetical protein
MTINFTDPTKAAAFVAELIRQGVTFEGRERENGTVDVVLTGGY